MSYLFTPPSVEEGALGRGRLFGRFRLHRGITLLVTGSTVTEVRYPTQEELDAADRYYRGGYIYTVSDAEAAILIAAGYSMMTFTATYSNVYTALY